MTTTDEQIVSDNSNLQTEAGGQKTTVQGAEQIQSKIEPATKVNEAVKKAEDTQAFEIPSKFVNKDGSTNISSLVKSYKELEPLLNEKANWQKEKIALTSQLSKFQTQNLFSDLSKQSVELYEKFLAQSLDKEKAKSLIEQFKKNPSEETIKELEALYPANVVKEVFLNAFQTRNTSNFEVLQKAQQQEFQNAQNYLLPVVEKNLEALKNPIAIEIFSETFNRFGTGLDTDWFFEKLNQLKESYIMDYQKSQSIKREKDSAISTASKLTPASNNKGGQSLLHRNALDLSPQELDRMLDEYYSK